MGAGAFCGFDYFDAQGNRIDYNTGKWTGTLAPGRWHTDSLTAISPKGTAAIKVNLAYCASGRVDCRRVRVTAEPVAYSQSDTLTLPMKAQPSVERFLGCGAEGDLFLFNRLHRSKGVTQEDIDKIGRYLSDMRLRVARMFFNYAWWEPEPGQYDFEGDDLQNYVKTVALFRDNGVHVNVCPWGDFHAYAAWQKDPGGNRAPRPDKVEASARSLAALLRYLLVDKGLDNVKYVTLLNEPDCVHIQYDIQRYKQGIRYLAEALEEYGIREKVQIVGSDDSSPPISGINPWFEFSVTPDIVDCYDIVGSHTYCHYFPTMPLLKKWIGDRRAAIARITDRPIPFAVMEFGHGMQPGENERYIYGLFAAAFALTAMNSGAVMLSFWSLMDTWYDDQLYSLWGMIRYKEHNFEPKPPYYAYALLCRYFAYGSRIYPLDCADSDEFCGSVSVEEDSGKLSVALVNYSGLDKTIHITDLPVQAGEWNCYVYREADLPADGRMIRPSGRVALEGGQCTVKVEAGTLVMLAME